MGTVAGIVVAMAGSAIIGLEDLGQGAHQLRGDLLAVVGALAVAIYLLIGRRLRPSLPLVAYVLPVYGSAAALLMILALLSHTPLTGFSLEIGSGSYSRRAAAAAPRSYL